jgi:flavin reductase (DIM6/NTAB) family NADH-FMN oxidoreductase RutF
MDAQSRKKALRMISYGLYIITSKSEKDIAGSTVTWVSQSSMQPPMVMVGLSQDSFTSQIVARSGKFALHFLGKTQKDIAQKFFKPAQEQDGLISGFKYKEGITGSPVLLDLPAYIECHVVETVKKGDHHVVIAEVIEAVVQHEMEPLALRETGWNYGG